MHFVKASSSRNPLQPTNMAAIGIKSHAKDQFLFYLQILDHELCTDWPYWDRIRHWWIFWEHAVWSVQELTRSLEMHRVGERCINFIEVASMTQIARRFLINILKWRQNGNHFADIFKYVLHLLIVVFWIKCHLRYFPISLLTIWQQSGIGWDNGLVPNMQRYIIWKNGRVMYWRI